MSTSQETQQNFGFKFGLSGAHSSRTVMYAELTQLFNSLPVDATLEDYREAIELDNVLHKPTSKTRSLTMRHLIDLYGMNPKIPLFRIFRHFWEGNENESARPLLASQIALARDSLLRMSLTKVLSLNVGERLFREGMEEVLREACSDRFSAATFKSLSQNVNGTWTVAGLLQGHRNKYRAEPEVYPVNVAFALLLGYLQGATGNRLFTSEWVKVLDSRYERLLELARQASYSGLLNFKHSSEVIEVSFPDYLTKEEEAWLYE